MEIGDLRLHFRSVSSTNDLCWQYEDDPSMHGLVVYADDQTKGRGQRGKVWHASAGNALLMSMLLHFSEVPQKPFVLTLWAALGICRYLDNLLGIKARLKWPNDVCVGNSKVAGVLVEQRRHQFVVGMGLNLNISDEEFKLANLKSAASVSHFTDKSLNPEQVLQQLLLQWNQSLQDIQFRQYSIIESDWQQYSELPGRQVTLRSHDQFTHGIITKLATDEVVIENESGRCSYQPEIISSIERHTASD